MYVMNHHVLYTRWFKGLESDLIPVVGHMFTFPVVNSVCHRSRHGFIGGFLCVSPRFMVLLLSGWVVVAVFVSGVCLGVRIGLSP